jgi:hypothetical protein
MWWDVLLSRLQRKKQEDGQDLFYAEWMAASTSYRVDDVVPSDGNDKKDGLIDLVTVFSFYVSFSHRGNIHLDPFFYQSIIFAFAILVISLRIRWVLPLFPRRIYALSYILS